MLGPKSDLKLSLKPWRYWAKVLQGPEVDVMIAIKRNSGWTLLFSTRYARAMRAARRRSCLELLSRGDLRVENISGVFLLVVLGADSVFMGFTSFLVM